MNGVPQLSLLSSLSSSPVLLKKKVHRQNWPSPVPKKGGSSIIRNKRSKVTRNQTVTITS